MSVRTDTKRPPTGKSHRPLTPRAAQARACKRLPELGDPVRVRGSAWIVTRVDPSPAGNGKRQHVVTLRAIGEDDQGTSAQVVWEAEPQRAVLDRFRFEVPMPLAPGSWHEPARLDALLRAVK